MGFGYLASQVESVKIPSKVNLVNQVSTFTRISKMTYSDKSIISTIDTDLLRTPIESRNISDNVKKSCHCNRR